MIKSIAIRENAGAIIYGVVSDTGTTNRKLWVKLRIGGKKDELVNSIVHPMDTKRKLYFFLKRHTYLKLYEIEYIT